MVSVKISSSVLNAKLSRSFRLETLFYLLPYTKCIQQNPPPGTLTYASYRDLTKGEKKSKKVGSGMKSAIILGFESSLGSTSAKLFSDSIQGTGIKSEEHFSEIYGYIADAVDEVIQFTNIMRNLDLSYIERVLQQKSVELSIHPTKGTFESVYSTGLSEISSRLSACITPLFFDGTVFICDIISLLSLLKDRCKASDPIIIDSPTNEPMSIIDIVYDNINYNFSTRPIDRERFHQFYQSRGATSIYFNEIQAHVSVTIGCSKFTVYAKGSVMQSGKDKLKMEEERSYFLQLFKEGESYFGI